MRQLLFPAIALAGALVAVVPAIDLAAAPKPKNIPVFVTFDDPPEHRILSDGDGEYRNGVNNVVAYIQASANGALIFGTNTSPAAGRTLRFSFDNCLSGCSHPWTTLDEKSGVVANALQSAGGAVLAGGMPAMAVGQQLPAFVKIDIPLDTDPAYWNVCFDSRDVVAACSPAGVDSTDARIHREASNRWRIFANETDRADLIKDSQTRKGNRFTTMGTYRMPFSFTVECVNSDCS